MPLLRTGVAEGTADLVDDEERRDELLDEVIRDEEEVLDELVREDGGELLDEVVGEDDARELVVVVVTRSEDVDILELELERPAGDELLVATASARLEVEVRAVELLDVAWPAIDELTSAELLRTVEPMEGTADTEDETAEFVEVDVVLYPCRTGMDVDVGTGNSELIGTSSMDVEAAGSFSSVSAAEDEAPSTAEDDGIPSLVNCTAVVKLADADTACSEVNEATVPVSEG